MVKVKVLIAAAGRGTRAGLPYPKTLFPISGKPILVHIIESFLPFDNKPTIIVSPSGLKPIKKCLSYYKFQAELLVQSEPKGMGDAVLCFAESNSFMNTDNILLVWGDIPFIQKNTVQSLLEYYSDTKSKFTFITKKVDLAYTLVARNQNNKVLQVIESREDGSIPQSGERDIGLFVFSKNIIFDLLREDLEGKYGNKTKEHGFLYIIKHLVAQGYNVDALPIATNLDLISLNSLEDLSDYL